MSHSSSTGLRHRLAREKVNFRVLVGFLLFLFALGQYGLRGTARALTSSADLAAPYAATRLFWHRANPYDQQQVNAEFERASLPKAYPAASLHPPHTFLLLSPLVTLRWQYARLLMALVNTALPLIAASMFVYSRRSQANLALSGALCILSVLLCAPLHTGIALGQLAVVSISVGFIAIQLASSGHRNAAGMFLAASLFAKPQVAFLLPLYFALRRWWRSFWICLGAFLLASLFVVIWWKERMFVFLQTLLGNYQQESTAGAISPSGPLYWQRIDLAPLWPSGSLILTSLAVTAVIVSLLPLFSRSFLTGLEGDRVALQELALASICLLTLLIVYHRYYDAYLLTIPAAHALLRHDVRPQLRTWAIRSLLAIPFLAPISAAVFVLGESMPRARVAVESPVGRLFMLNVNISLLVILGCFVWRLSKRLRAGQVSVECL